jgi:hypothetical protein
MAINYRTGTGAANLDSKGRKNVFKKGGARASRSVFVKSGLGVVY